MKGKCVFFSLKYCFWLKFRVNSVHLHFAPKPLLKKIIKTCSSLKWCQSKKCTKCVRIFWNKYIFAAAFEKPPFRNISRINLCSEAPSRRIFQYCCSELVVKFFEKNGDGVQFLVNSHVMLTNSCQKAIFYHIINRCQTTTSAEVLLCLEAVVCRCSSK